MMDFANFLAQQKAPEAPPARQPEASAFDPHKWPVAVYQAVGDGIPGEPFVAYPMVPQKGGYAVTVRCAGPTAEAARAKAHLWLMNEAEKVERRNARGKKGSEG